jgi:hypothetical protein
MRQEDEASTSAGSLARNLNGSAGFRVLTFPGQGRQ